MDNKKKGQNFWPDTPSKIIAMAVMIAAFTWILTVYHYENALLRAKTTCKICQSKIQETTSRESIKNAPASFSGSVSLPNNQSNSQNDNKNNDQAIATNFFTALKNRNIQEATQYCEPQIIDDRGIFGLYGQSYSVDYVCSAIGSRLDDKWVVRVGKPDESFPDEKIVSFFDTKDKSMQNAVQRNGEWYLDGNKKIISSSCIPFAMHQINGEWKIYRISSMKSYIYEIEN